MKPMYESVEIKQVWKPEKSYTVNEGTVDGKWREFFRGKKSVGVLYTDGTTSLDFRGQGGETDVMVKANQLIQMSADMGYSAQDGFDSVTILLEKQEGLTSTHQFGLVPPPYLDDENSYSISVKDDKEVIALVKLTEDGAEIRIDGEWEKAASGDPRVENVPFVDVNENAVQLWDEGSKSIDDYQDVRIDDQ